MSTLVCSACNGRGRLTGSIFNAVRGTIGQTPTDEPTCWRCAGTGAITDAAPLPEEHDA